MATPIELEQQRQEEAAAAEKQTLSANQKSVETNQIQKSTPEDQKPKGAAKLSSILFTLGSQIPQIIQPSLENLINSPSELKGLFGLICSNNIFISSFLIVISAPSLLARANFSI